MFDLDNFREIWETIKKNKLRTFLTGFSVSWGIFMLILLLGAGNGLRNGIMYNFRNMANNQVTVGTGWTSMPYKGFSKNRRILFNRKDIEELPKHFSNIEYISADITHGGLISHNHNNLTGEMTGTFPDKRKITFIEFESGKGRFINDLDIKMRRKVAVIDEEMEDILFPDGEALGQFIECENIMFRVVGVCKKKDNDNSSAAYIPFNVAQQLYNKGYGFRRINFTINGITTEKQTDEFELNLRHWIGKRHFFAAEDKGAMWMWSTTADFANFELMMKGILLFIWIIGIGTLTAGIVGVSNIMLITVKERKREFGIRKAIGAQPLSIIRLIIVESLIITATFGYIGMLGGIGITQSVSYAMEQQEAVTQQKNKEAKKTGDEMGNPSVFRDPTVNFNLAMSATLLLIVAGILAGYFPARKAVKIPAIEAMRDE